MIISLVLTWYALTSQAQPSLTIPLAIAPVRVESDSFDVVTSAPSFAVMDVASGAILHERDAIRPRSIGSITKLMTALIFLDSNPDWSAPITFTAADRQIETSARIRTGETVSLADAFAATLIASDNDAAMVLARSTGMSLEEFVRAMNARASALGMLHTTFVEPTGLHEGNQSTARDIIILLRAALAREDIARSTKQRGAVITVQTSTGGIRNERIYTTNQLIGGPYQVLGGKTGYIPASGYCLVMKSTTESGHALFVAVLGSVTLADRFTDMKSIIQWVDNNYVWN